MKNCSVVLCAFMILSCSTISQTANAGSYYSINKRAYKRMLFNTVRTNYPSPFAQRFWGFMDRSVLQSDGLLEQTLKKLIEGLGSSDSVLNESVSMVAKRDVVTNPDLARILAETEKINDDLGIVVEPLPQGKKDLRNFNKRVDFPAGVEVAP